MKISPFLISASLLFWGWQTGLLPAALFMVFILEAEWFIKSKWDFSVEDFNRVADLCSVFLIGTVIYLIVISHREVIHVILKWLPVIVFFLIAAQKYSVAGKINIGSMMLLTRKRKIRKVREIADVDVSYPYIIICVIAAGVGNVRTNMFYIFVMVLTCWGLFPFRSRRYSIGLWLILFVCAGGAGYVGHLGISRLQSVVTEMAIEFFMGGKTDPFNRSTAIGDIGRLKLSNRIVFRVDKKSSAPIHLKESSYNQFNSNRWFATHSEFHAINPGINGTSWQLQQGQGEDRNLSVYSGTKKGKSLLKLPKGSIRLENLKAGKLEKNSLGAVKVVDSPGFISYSVIYNPETSLDRPPDDKDLFIPELEVSIFIKLVEKLQLQSKVPDQTLNTIHHYFSRNFKYSLKLEGKGSYSSPIENFLTGTKKGHCELFATATVFILRAAGLPARYVSGYLAHEYSEFENMMVVRGRDAHAWVQVFVEGHWRDFDTTPSTWPDYESENLPGSIISDFFSVLQFKFLKWQSELTKEQAGKLALLLLVPLVVILWFRLRSAKKIKRVRQPESGKEQKKVFTHDENSGLYLVEKKLKELGYERYPSETFHIWLQRLMKSKALILPSREINELLVLHYRERYGDGGLKAGDKDRLQQHVARILEQM